MVVTLSDGVNTVVREVPLVVQKPVALKASYNAGNFEILATSGNALRLNRSPLDEVRLGLLADELTVVRLSDAPLMVRASEGADQITMDLGNTLAADGLPRTLRLEDVDSGPSEMRDDTLSLRFKPVASSTTKNVVTLANGKLVSGIENIEWDQTLGTLRLSGDSIVIKAQGDGPMDLGDTRLVVDAKTLVMEGDLRVRDASRVVLNISEKITLTGIKLYGANGAADTNLAVANVLSKGANGAVQAQVVQSVKLAIPEGGGAVDLSAYVTEGAGLQITPPEGVAISLGGKGGGLALDPSKIKGDTTLVLGSSGGSNPVAMGGGESELVVPVALTIQSSGVGGKVEVAGSVKGKKLTIFGPGNTTVFANGTVLAMSQGTVINDAIRFDGSVVLKMGDAATDQAADLQVTGRVNGSTGSADVLDLSAHKGNINIGGRVGAGIGATAQSITITQAGRNFGADTSQAVANADGSFTYQGVILTGGSGSGATADIRVKDGVVVGVSLVSVGGGFQVGDSLTVARAQLGDLVARTAAERDSWALRLQVRELANIEGLVVSNAMNVTFGEQVYVDGDITIKATGKVVFSDAVVLRNGGQLIIDGAQEVVFYKGIEFGANAQGKAGALQVTSGNSSVSFLSGLFAGKNDAMSWSGISKLDLQAPQTATQLGSLAVVGTQVVLSQAPGFANLNLNLDSLSVATQSLAMPASSAVTVNMNLGSLDLNAATGIGAQNAFMKVNAQQIVAKTTTGDIFMQITGSQAVALDVKTITQGDVHLRLTAADTLSAQVLAQGKIDVAGSGSLTLTPGSRLESKANLIAVTAQGDLMASGTTLVSNVAKLKAGQAINALDSAQASPVSISGDLRLEAVTGLGDFGYGRFLINNLNPSASVSAYNEKSGDVVLAGVNGLTLSAAGVKSDAPGDAWVGLLTGTGSITELGQVVARSNNVVRLTGSTWMARPSAGSTITPPTDTTTVPATGVVTSPPTTTTTGPTTGTTSGASVLTKISVDAQKVGDAIRSGVRLGSSEGLDTFNRMMEKSFTLNALSESGSARVLSQGPVMSKPTQKTLSLSPTALPVLGLGVTSSPQSTAQLLDMAMTVVQQTPSAVAQDTETLGNWVSRTAPTVNPVEASPAPESSRDGQSTPSGAAEARPELSAPTPNNDGGLSVPNDPPPPSVPAPSSGVQWLLPADDVAVWTEGLSQPSDFNNSNPGASGLMGAVAKLGQWLGWGRAGSSEPSDQG